MGRVIRIEMADGTHHLVKSEDHGNTGAVFFSLAQAERAYNPTGQGASLPPHLIARFNADGIIVHDEHCDWW